MCLKERVLINLIYSWFLENIEKNQANNNFELFEIILIEFNKMYLT